MPTRALVLVLLLVACGASAPSPAAPPTVADPVIADPAAAFAALEARLEAAERVEILAHLSSEGAVTTDFEGHLRISQGRLLHMDFKGTRDGAPAETLLLSDGVGLNGGDAPPALIEGLLIGLTRMGLLHNVVITAAGAAPDGTDGYVRESVTVGDLRVGPVETVGRTRAASIVFAVSVNGSPVAEATLFLHPRTGLPLMRRQLGYSPHGELQVVERYGTFTVEP